MRFQTVHTPTSLTEGPISQALISFALPLLLGNLFQQLYNTADSLIVGNFLGSEALAAVSSSGNLIFLMVGLVNGVSMGAGVVIARYFGAKDYDRIQKTIHTLLAFGLVAGALLTVVGVALSPVMLRLMDTPETVLPNSISYFRTYFTGSLAFVLYNICMGILQAVGDSRHPLQYLIISSLVNVVLDLLFVGVFHMGVWSAAAATAISQLVSMALCLLRLMRSERAYRVSLRKIRFDRRALLEILQNGLPAGLQNSIISIGNVVVQSNINQFGAAAMAGCGDAQAGYETLKQRYPSLGILLTLGSEGSVSWKDGTEVRQCAYPVKAVDTTGAGDTFMGYFVGCLAQGMERQTAMQYASMASAISVTRPGAAASIPLMDEVRAAVEAL